MAIGLSVILAEDQGARRATRKELAALEAAPGKVAAKFADNALVQALLADVKANAAAEQVEKHSREKGQTEQRIYEETYRMCQQVAAVLFVKTTYEEARGYKRFAAEVGAEVPAPPPMRVPGYWRRDAEQQRTQAAARLV